MNKKNAEERERQSLASVRDRIGIPPPPATSDEYIERVDAFAKEKLASVAENCGVSLDSSMTSWLYPAARGAGQLLETHHANGELAKREYKLNAEPHRAGGPAREWFEPDGTRTRYEYYVDGEQVDDPEQPMSAPGGPRL